MHRNLLGVDFAFFIFLAILAFFYPRVSPNKYIGYFVYIAFLIANFFVWRALHVGTHMVQFGTHPTYTYSDFYGYAPYLQGLALVQAYWSAFCGLLAVASVLLWRRGRETSLAASAGGCGPAIPRAGGCDRRAVRFGVRGHRAVDFLQHRNPESRVTDNDSRTSPPITRKPTRSTRACRSRASPTCITRSTCGRKPRNARMRGDEVIVNRNSTADR